MHYLVDRRRLTLQINADPRVMEKLDNLLEEVGVSRTVAAGNPKTTEEVIYHLPHEPDVTKAEGVLSAAQILLSL